MEPTEKPTEKDTKAEAQDDLTKLLDSCLDDFNKSLPKPVQATTKDQKKSTPAATASDSASASANPGDVSTWTEEFKKLMETYMDDEGEVTDMKKWMETLSGDQNPPLGDEDLTRTFADTLRELTEQAQNIPETSPEELATLLGGLDFGDQNVGDQISDVMPLMQNVMQKLMSKELLYPSIKEIAEKYPDWLREKQSSLTTEQYDNYKMQYDLMLKVCEEFEKETDSSEAANKEQFEKVLQLMQKIQNYGNPPKELVSNIGPGVPLDEQGNLQIPGMPPQCSIM